MCQYDIAATVINTSASSSISRESSVTLAIIPIYQVSAVCISAAVMGTQFTLIHLHLRGCALSAVSLVAFHALTLIATCRIDAVSKCIAVVQTSIAFINICE